MLDASSAGFIGRPAVPASLGRQGRTLCLLLRHGGVGPAAKGSHFLKVKAPWLTVLLLSASGVTDQFTHDYTNVYLSSESNTTSAPSQESLVGSPTGILKDFVL